MCQCFNVQNNIYSFEVKSLLWIYETEEYVLKLLYLFIRFRVHTKVYTKK